ncbi:MAG TPA: hypothetical protein VKB50_21855 [Vicinamibacterales bacterium]|nr:hypothetical protein [Vicinamibacterales bacterium]
MSPVAPACPVHLRATFLEEPRYVTLPAGERLYKFVSIPIVRQRIVASPWWIRQTAFDDLQVRARRLDVPMRDLVRSQLAIAGEWNPGMDMVFIAVLSASVDAWEGRARSQRVTLRDPQVVFTGGGLQLCAPGLTWLQIGVQFTGTIDR